MGRPVWLGLLGAALAGVLVLGVVHHESGVRAPGGLYVRSFDYVTNPLEVTLAKGDGQYFAAVAEDPTLSRPQAFLLGAPDEAYRAQRPLASYLAWALSGGQRGTVPLALALLFVAGSGLAVGATAALAGRRGASELLGLVILLVPASLAAVQWLGPEPLGMGLASAGVLAWDRADDLARHGRWSAVGLFSLAALTRESLLLIPLVVGVFAVVRGGRRLLDVSVLALPAVAWLAWVALVHARLDHWPWDSGGGRLSAPFTGLVAGVRTWPVSGAGEWLVGLVLVVLVVSCIWRRPLDRATWIVVGYAVFATILGSNVWLRWQDFSRPLFPLYVFGLLVLLSREDAPAAPTATVPPRSLEEDR